MNQTEILLTRALGTLGALTFAASVAVAEPTRELYISDVEEVFSGDPVSTRIDAQGQVYPGPIIEPRGPELGRAVTTVAAGRAGLWVGTAGGGLHLVNGSKAAKVLEAKDKVVTALMPVGRSTLVALAPKADVLRVDAKGKKKTVVKLKASYVWGIAAAKTRTLLATGKPGQVVAVDEKGRTEVWLESDESHLRAIVEHPERGWIVGGGQKGIVYQLVGNKKARALYDSRFEEVTAFAVDAKRGDLYAAFVSATTAGKPLPERWIGPTKGEKREKSDRSPFKGSEVVRIKRNGQVEVLWSSDSEGALALVYRRNRLYFSTGTAGDGRARVYAIDVADRDRLSLWGRLTPALAPALIADDQLTARGRTGQGSLLAGTAPAGRVYRIRPDRRAESTYLSVEQDLARTARVGSVWFDADIPKGASVAVSIRSGNTKKPDDTWSKWSAPVTDPDGGAVKVPDARYVQLRAVLKSAKAKEPRLKSMHASVVRHNVAPQILEVFMLRPGVFLQALPFEKSKTKTLTLNKRSLSELRRPPKDKETTRVRQTLDSGARTIAWRVDDVDGDGLLYRVEMRRLDGAPSEWRELDRNRPEPFWSFDSRAFADGQYQFRVTATDRPSNPPGEALTDRHVSEPVLFDNTAPAITAAKLTRGKGKRVTVTATVEDAASRIDVAELSVNGGPWLMLPAADGLLDARKEALKVTLTPKDLRRGSERVTTVRIRVRDEAGNEATASARAKR